MSKKFVEDLKEGERIRSNFSIKYKKPIKSYKKGYMFTLGLADKTGEIEAKYWGEKDQASVEKIHDKINPGDVIKIEGRVSSFKDNLEINIQSGHIKKTENFEIENFVDKSKKNIDEMFSKLKRYMDTIQSKPLSNLVKAFLEDEKFCERYKKSPAAMFYHHAYIGGLLEHSLSMMQIAETLCEIHPKLDRDLLIFGCFIHDIGKIEEFKVTTNIKQSKSGLLSGHITIGQEILSRKISEINDFPKELKHKLLHIIASHHGKKEYGALKEPMFPEAAAVFFIDELDSQIFQYIDLKESADTEDFHIWTKRFGQIYLK